jgi:2-methylcitrate dehydratase PrpD
VLEAAIAGWEFAIRMGLAGQDYDGPHHSTSITGTFAAALIAARLFGLSADSLADALGIAGSQAAGSRQAIQEGAWSGRMHGGWPGLAGVYAALLAGRGLSGPRQVFEGPRGLYRTYVPGESHPERLVDGLGTRWETPATLFKLFPCCQQTQSSMHAVRQIVRREGFKPEVIERIDCFVTREARHTYEPRAAKLRPRTDYQSAFSLPYCVAVAVLDDEVSLESFEEARRGDADVLAMTDRVFGTEDDTLVASASQPARIVVTTTDGQQFGHASAAPGAPENPELRDAVLRKFRASTGPALPPEGAEALLSALEDLESVEDVREIARLASRA